MFIKILVIKKILLFKQYLYKYLLDVFFLVGLDEDNNGVSDKNINHKHIHVHKKDGNIQEDFLTNFNSFNIYVFLVDVFLRNFFRTFRSTCV